MNEDDWVLISTAGATEAEVRARLEDASAHALILLRAELIEMGLTQATVARGLADLWMILMRRIDEQLPALLARLNAEAPGPRLH